MSRHEDDVRLGHMLDQAIKAIHACEAKTRPDLDTDRMLNLALVRLIEDCVGEAANRVSQAGVSAPVGWLAGAPWPRGPRL